MYSLFIDHTTCVIFASFHQGKEEIKFAFDLFFNFVIRGWPVPDSIRELAPTNLGVSLRPSRRSRVIVPTPPKKFPLPIPLLYVILFPREKLPTGNHPQISSGASPDRPEFEIRNCIAAHTGVFYENSRVIEKQEALFHPPSRRGRGNDGSRSRSNRFPQMLHGRKEGQPRGLPLREEAEGR